MNILERSYIARCVGYELPAQGRPNPFFIYVAHTRSPSSSSPISVQLYIVINRISISILATNGPFTADFPNLAATKPSTKNPRSPHPDESNSSTEYPHPHRQNLPHSPHLARR